ncbi:MAG: NAD(+) diphosphatase [Nitratireductor sp.]
MTIDFDRLAHPEPSSLVGFSGNRLVRDAEHRDGETLSKALAHPQAKFHVYSGAKALVRKGEEPGATFALDEIREFRPELEHGILLGTDGSVPRIAVRAQINEETIAGPYKLYDFRSLLYSSAVSEAETGAIAQGGSLLHWHQMNRHCGKCGTPSSATSGGYRRDCPDCGSQIFPRTDPVVIMLAIRKTTRGEKCLMGRSPHFPPGWFSTLAGFVEPGETIEDAVRRETHEESGIVIGRVGYYASQPWPFPHSLMIGVHCEAMTDEIARDASELDDCRWFTREDVRLMIADTHPDGFKCPPSRAIAHALIRAWVG